MSVSAVLTDLLLHVFSCFSFFDAFHMILESQFTLHPDLIIEWYEYFSAAAQAKPPNPLTRRRCIQYAYVGCVTFCRSTLPIYYNRIEWKSAFIAKQLIPFSCRVFVSRLYFCVNQKRYEGKYYQSNSDKRNLLQILKNLCSLFPLSVLYQNGNKIDT